MLRGLKSSLLVVGASAGLALFAGCPAPSQPVAKNGDDTTQKNGTDTSSSGSGAKTEEPLPPDDAAAVQALKDAGSLLVTDKEGRVTEVELTRASDELLEQVAKLPGVTKLTAGGPDVTNKGLEKIKDMKRLRVLDLDQADVNDEGMAHLMNLPLVDINLKLTNVQDDGVGHLSKIKTLKQLKLIKTKVTNEGVKHVQNMPQLEGLDLQDVNTVDTSCLAHVKGLKKLKMFRIWGPTFSGDGIAPIGEMTWLKSLSMEQCGVTDENIQHLKGLTNLERLSLYGTKPSDEGLKNLAGMTKLKQLSLREIKGLGKLEFLAGMKDLRDLDLSESNATDEAMDQVGKLASLEALNLWLSAVGDAGVAKLANLKNLKELNLDKTQITDAALDTVAKYEKLEFLHLGNTNISDAGLAKLHGLKNLKTVHLTFIQNITSDGIDKLGEAIPALQEGGIVQ